VSNGLATVQATNPLAILAAAVERGADPDQLEKLLALQERYERNEAAKAFADALTTFQSKCPTIRKNRTATITGSRSSYSYNFASYDDVMRQITGLLTECGLALSFSTENQDKGIRVTLKIRHGTHVEPHTLDVPVPAMSVNDTQRYGAALSYAKRYALCAALNIVVSDEDDDAQSAVEPISDEQARELEAFIDEHDIDQAAFLNWIDVGTIADIPAHRLDNAWAGLRAKARAAR
jgi:hypothetical protein